VQQKSITGGGDNKAKGPEQEVTDVAGGDKDTEACAKTATSVGKEGAGDLGEKEVPVASKNAGQIPESDITGGRANTVTGGSDLSLKGPDKEVTNDARETTDIKAGAKTASAVDNEVNNGVEEKEVMSYGCK
jgi:hypothetical protein